MKTRHSSSNIRTTLSSTKISLEEANPRSEKKKFYLLKSQNPQLSFPSKSTNKLKINEITKEDGSLSLLAEESKELCSYPEPMDSIDSSRMKSFSRKSRNSNKSNIMINEDSIENREKTHKEMDNSNRSKTPSKNEKLNKNEITPFEKKENINENRDKTPLKIGKKLIEKKEKINGYREKTPQKNEKKIIEETGKTHEIPKKTPQKNGEKSVEKKTKTNKKELHYLKEKEKNLEKYALAIEKLQEYSLPETIPCREKEKKCINDFLMEGLQNKGSNQTLYISGIPGIGKTVSFLEVIKNLQSNTQEEFKFININGMSLKDPENVYLILLEEITGIKNVSRSTACIILNDLFRNNRLPKQYKKELVIKQTKIILLDELDYLLTKDQTILYNLFEWPHCKFSNIIMAGIANTVDFPERLQPKIASRIGNSRLTYKPYSSIQIEEIIRERISSLNDVFTIQAVTFVSKKIAAFSSDIRRTLNVCRKAVEILQQEMMNDQDSNYNFKKIDIDQIRASYDLLYSSAYMECLKNFSLFQKLLIISLALETKNQDCGRVSFLKVFERVRSMMSNLGMRDSLKSNDALQIFYQMVNINLLTVKEKNVVRTKKTNETESKNYYLTNLKDFDLNISISIDDVTNSLKDDEIFLKFLCEF